MTIGAALYELDSELRLAFIRIEESETPQDMETLFISMCHTVTSANQIIIEAEAYNLLDTFYGRANPSYHPLIEQLYLEYFSELNSEAIEQAYLKSEFNSLLI
ncbi:hypothetical protein [Vibrio campbellii]|uniref:hypothetical protein n=1 Tax=Vibrio harveyi group TaxID=717610 RepID=UPI000CD34ACC|nr:hypothetical protein [Vibrio campbellii]AUW07561.1 hypothetical protein C1N51_28485 [Vibrio campbellii]